MAGLRSQSEGYHMDSSLGELPPHPPHLELGLSSEPSEALSIFSVFFKYPVKGIFEQHRTFKWLFLEGTESNQLLSSPVWFSDFFSCFIWVQSYLLGWAQRSSNSSSINLLARWSWANYLNSLSLGSSDSIEPACNAEDPGSIPGSGRSPEKEMVTHSSILAWRIPWMEKPVGYSPGGRKELDMTERLHFTSIHFSIQFIWLLK